MSYTYDHVVLDNERLLERNAITAYGVLVESDRQLTTGQFRVDFKDYKENNSLPNAESQSGTNYLVGFLHMLRFGNDRHYVRGGYQFDYDDTDGRNYTYVGPPLLGGRAVHAALVRHPARLRLRHALSQLPARQHRAAVDAPGTVERSDHEFTNIVRVEVPLPWFARDQQLFLTGEYTGKIANSNIDVFQYTPQLRRDLLHLAVLSRSRRDAPAQLRLGRLRELGQLLGHVVEQAALLAIAGARNARHWRHRRRRRRRGRRGIRRHRRGRGGGSRRHRRGRSRRPLGAGLGPGPLVGAGAGTSLPPPLLLPGVDALRSLADWPLSSLRALSPLPSSTATS